MSQARHPVEALIRHCVFVGEPPDPQDIDALQLADEDRKSVRDAIDEGLRIHATGLRGDANNFAHEVSREVIAYLPADQQQPDYIERRDSLADATNPDELAQRIPR